MKDIMVYKFIVCSTEEIIINETVDNIFIRLFKKIFNLPLKYEFTAYDLVNECVYEHSRNFYVEVAKALQNFYRDNTQALTNEELLWLKNNIKFIHRKISWVVMQDLNKSV